MIRGVPDVVPKLAYARDGSTRARTWTRRIVLLAWVVLTAHLAYDKWGGRARLQVDLLRAQSRCLVFVEPKERVVFDTDAAWFPGLLRQTGYVGIEAYSRAEGIPDFVTPGNPARAPRTDAVVSAVALGPLDGYRAARNTLNRWDELRNPAPAGSGGGGLFGPGRGGGGFLANGDTWFVVMLHGRHAADGPERLVTLYGEWFGAQDRLEFHAAVTAPASVAGRPEDLVDPMGPSRGTPLGFALPTRPGGTPVRLYAGQPDANDAARFTWYYELPEGRGTFEGRLRADDTVDLRAISGPALNQPAP